MIDTNMCSNFGGKWDSPAPTLEWLFLFCYAGGLSLYVFFEKLLQWNLQLRILILMKFFFDAALLANKLFDFTERALA